MAAVIVALLTLGTWPVGAATFDFVHVESNAGGSSGGHVALCFEEPRRHCYHFQQAADATLLLVREDRARFEHGYRAVGNRALNVRRIEVSDGDFEKLSDELAAYHRVQSRQIEARDAYAADLALLGYLAARNRGAPAPGDDVSVPGAGYFFDPTQAPMHKSSGWRDTLLRVRSPELRFAGNGRAEARPSSPESGGGGRAAATIALADRMRTAYGADILERRAQELLGLIHGLRPDVTDVVLPDDAASPLSTPRFFAERYRELLAGYLAIAVLREGRGLRADALIQSSGDDLALSTAERATLRRYATELEDQLVSLFASRRPDWGYPLLIGIARWLSINAAAASGRLALLDTFPNAAPTLPPAAWAGLENAFDQLVDERRQDFAAARAAFFDADTQSEARWSRIELAGNLYVEMSQARAARVPLRVHHHRPVPERAAWRDDWPTPVLDHGTLAVALATAQARDTAYRAAFQDLYRYDLVTRNCATELLHALPSGGNERDHAALNGALTFVPFVAADTVGAHYLVVDTFSAPSYRQLALTRSVATNALVARLRETNVLTSRIYRWHPEDSVFLLFSDDVPALRPIAGVVNLTASLAASTAGLLWLPLDSGALLRSALNGMLYSLPELGFISIRKGTFPLAPRAWLAPPLSVDANELIEKR